MGNRKLAIVDNLKIEESNIDQILEIRKKIISQPANFEKISIRVDKKYNDEQQEIILMPFKTFCDENDIDYKKKYRVGEALYRVYGRIIGHRIENLRVYHLLNIGKSRLLNNYGIGPRALASFQLALREHELSLSKPLTNSELVYFDRLSHDNPYSRINK